MLSWTFICAPIAVRTRLTLYWYLRKIAGPGVTFIYNFANAFLYCILAGAMISVSATAVGLVFGIPVPKLGAVLPRLGVSPNFFNFWQVATTTIWYGVAAAGRTTA